MLAGLNAAFSDEAINCYKQKTCRGGGKGQAKTHCEERRSFTAVGTYPCHWGSLLGNAGPGSAYQGSDDLLCLTQRGK